MRTDQPDPTDKELMDAIRAGGREREYAWRYIYKNWGEYCCRTTIKVTECDKDEAAAAFSIACVGVDKRICTTEGYDFLVKASLKTYLTSATIRAAWAVMHGRKKDPDDEGIDLPGGDLGKWFDRQNCHDTLDNALTGIGPRCKKILQMFDDGYSMEEIAEEMGLANAEVAKNQKYKCGMRFKEYLIANPKIRKELEDNCYG